MVLVIQDIPDQLKRLTSPTKGMLMLIRLMEEKPMLPSEDASLNPSIRDLGWIFCYRSPAFKDNKAISLFESNAGQGQTPQRAAVTSQVV